MAATLTGRIWAGFVLSAAAMVAVSTLWVVNDRRAVYLDELNNRTRSMVIDAGNVLSYVKDAETGARGYIITGSETYLEPYEGALAYSPEIIDRLNADLPPGNSGQRERVGVIAQLVHERLKQLKQGMELRRDSGFNAARLFVLTDQDKHVMDQLRAVVSELIAVQTEVAQQGQIEVANLRRTTLLYLEAAAGGIVLILFLTALSTSMSISRRLRDLAQGAARLAGGDLDSRIQITSKDELSAVAQRFNDMADALQKGRAGLRDANEKLSRYAGNLRLLGAMVQRLQECVSIEEFADAVQRFAPDIVRGRRGALFLTNESQTLVGTVATWGEPLGTETQFQTGDCWALRRGQPHVYSFASPEVRCPHIHPDFPGSYACVPIMGHGALVGLLHFEFGDAAAVPAASEDGPLLDEQTQAFSEDVSLALVNLSLRETQRSQSTRDALTSLFNRRYLDEALELEFEKAVRSRLPLYVIMCDIDHFKLFNDTHGHDCGDMVLKAMAQALSSHARKGDIVCRYGGEEFTIVMPGATLDVACSRAEILKQTVKERTITWQGRSIDPATMSFGVAGFPEDGENARDVMRAADQALLRAKAEGRDRVVSAARVQQALPVPRTTVS